MMVPTSFPVVAWMISRRRSPRLPVSRVSTRMMEVLPSIKIALLWPMLKAIQTPGTISSTDSWKVFSVKFLKSCSPFCFNILISLCFALISFILANIPGIVKQKTETAAQISPPNCFRFHFHYSRSPAVSPAIISRRTETTSAWSSCSARPDTVTVPTMPAPFTHTGTEPPAAA